MIWMWIERVWQDLRHGARIFAKNPGFTAIAVLSIAFGTGANVAIFSVVDAMLLRPLPAARPDELLAIGTDVPRGRMVFKAASYPDYLDLRERTTTFSGLLAYADPSAFGRASRRYGPTSTEPTSAASPALVQMRLL